MGVEVSGVLMWCARGGEKCEVFDRIDYNFCWICADVGACVVARCCVRVMHDSIISERPGVVLAGAPR